MNEKIANQTCTINIMMSFSYTCTLYKADDVILTLYYTSLI